MSEMTTRISGGQSLVNLLSSPTATTSSSSASRRVEVRWLHHEAESYLHQWQRRYHQLEGISSCDSTSCHQQMNSNEMMSNQLESYDDWCFTAKRILDLDLIDLRNNDNNNKSGGENVDTLFTWRQTANEPLLDDRRLLISGARIKDNNMKNLCGEPAQSLVGTDSYDASNDGDEDDDDDDVDADDDFDATFNVCNTICSSNKLRNRFSDVFINNNNSINDNDSILSSINNDRKGNSLLDGASSISDTMSASTSSHSRSRAKSKSRPRSRPRPPPSRRQIFKCEHPGCSYQSDRNFNFLRHKRTHRKHRGVNNNNNSSNIIINNSNNNANNNNNIKSTKFNCIQNENNENNHFVSLLNGNENVSEMQRNDNNISSSSSNNNNTNDCNDDNLNHAESLLS